MNLEIREDSTYTFTLDRVEYNATKAISSANLLIYSPSGGVYQASTAMTITSGVATKAINFATDPTDGEYARARHYKAEFQVTYTDGTIEHLARFFDIVRYPFVCLVKDQDLMDENRLMEQGIQEEGGEATSGSTTTLVDLNRIEPNDYWNGGKLLILPIDDSGKITEHTVTDFVKSTGTITFTPAATAVTTNNYTLRRSYQVQINTAADIVREQIASQGKQAYLMVDDTQVSRLVIYKCLERYFQQIRKTEGDQYSIQFEYYKSEYEKLFNAIPLLYDEDDSGSIDEDESTPGTFGVVEMSI